MFIAFLNFICSYILSIVQIYRFYFYSKQNLDYFLINLIFAENKPIRIDMKLDHNSDKPLHIQAEEILRRLIESEEYKNGKLFPNEVELSEQLHISRNTLRQAINKLVFEGLLVRKKGYGTKVVKKGIVGGVKNWLSFSQEMKMLGIEIRNFELHISLKRPTEEIGTFFDLGSNPDTRCVVMERVRGKKRISVCLLHLLFQPQYSTNRRGRLYTPIIRNAGNPI